MEQQNAYIIGSLILPVIVSVLIGVAVWKKERLPWLAPLLTGLICAAWLKQRVEAGPTVFGVILSEGILFLSIAVRTGREKRKKRKHPVKRIK